MKCSRFFDLWWVRYLFIERFGLWFIRSSFFVFFFLLRWLDCGWLFVFVVWKCVWWVFFGLFWVGCWFLIWLCWWVGSSLVCGIVFCVFVVVCWVWVVGVCCWLLVVCCCVWLLGVVWWSIVMVFWLFCDRCRVRCLVWFSLIVGICVCFCFWWCGCCRGFIVWVVGVLDFSDVGWCGRKICVFWYVIFFCCGVCYWLLCWNCVCLVFVLVFGFLWCWCVWWCCGRMGWFFGVCFFGWCVWLVLCLFWLCGDCGRWLFCGIFRWYLCVIMGLVVVLDRMFFVVDVVVLRNFCWLNILLLDGGIWLLFCVGCGCFLFLVVWGGVYG